MNLRVWIRTPLFWILLAAAALRLAGLFWGLPNSDGWDDDGFAPRNFLTALALTWKPGSYFTYPPLQALLLAIPSLPVAGWALMHAASLHQADVIAEITKPFYMTYFSVVARLVNLAMSLGIIATTGKMAELIAGRRAGLFAAGACALGAALTYYGQVSNLDVPYLFWSMLALLWWMQAIVRQKPKQFREAALFAAAAIATKDQAYALFLISLPLSLVVWFTVDAWPRRYARKLLMVLALSGVVAIFLLLLVDGAITNPDGFVRRLAFLAGPASQDYAEYSHGLVGFFALLQDMATYYTGGIGIPACVLTALGLGLCSFKPRSAVWVAGLMPLFGMLSFTLCFNAMALRTDDRFLLPQAIFACVYIGIAAAWLTAMRRPVLRTVMHGILALFAIAAIHRAAAVDVAMLSDPRYDAEVWLRAHVRAGDSVEIYGQNVFQPRLPPDAHGIRVGQTALSTRNPQPGVLEVKAPFSGARNARFIVVNANWAQRYLIADTPLPPGRIYSKIQQAEFRDADARAFFARLRNGSLGYQLVYASVAQSDLWPQIHVHDSLDETIWIFERVS